MEQESQRQAPSHKSPTLVIEMPQFQHYYSPELDQNPEMEVELDKKYPIRSCLTQIEEGQSKRCECGKYLLIRSRAGLRREES